MTDLMASRCCCVQGPCTWTIPYATRSSYVVTGISGTYERQSSIFWPPNGQCQEVCGGTAYALTVNYSQEVPLVINRQCSNLGCYYVGLGEIDVSGTLYIFEGSQGGYIPGPFIAERTHTFSRSTICKIEVGCHYGPAQCGGYIESGWFHRLTICDFIVTCHDEGIEYAGNCTTQGYPPYERGIRCAGGGATWVGPREFLHWNMPSFATGWLGRFGAGGPFSLMGMPECGNEPNVQQCQFPLSPQINQDDGVVGNIIFATHAACSQSSPNPLHNQFLIDLCASLTSPCGSTDMELPPCFASQIQSGVGSRTWRYW